MVATWTLKNGKPILLRKRGVAMSCVAIQVRTGHEMHAAMEINRITGIKTITLGQETTTLDEQGRIKKGFKPVVTGYILVDIVNITAEIWHMIKKVPAVIRILVGVVEDEEVSKMQKFCYSVVKLTSTVKIPGRKEKLLATTPEGVITETIKNRKRIVTIPFNIITAINRREIFGLIIREFWYLKNTFNNKYLCMLC